MLGEVSPQDLDGREFNEALLRLPGPQVRNHGEEAGSSCNERRPRQSGEQTTGEKNTRVELRGSQQWSLYQMVGEGGGLRSKVCMGG